MNFKPQVIRFKVRQLKKKLTTEGVLLYAKFSPFIAKQNPDFLGIGPARSATGWLHRRLSIHPEIFLPTKKEIHFFDRKSTENSMYFFDLSNPIHWKWYHYYFRNSKGRIKGEITPAYSVLDEKRIEEISTHLPNVKLIYSIRDPIDRAWSSLRFRLWYGKGITASELSPKELKAIIKEPEIITKSDHIQNISQWERYFSERNLHYMFYDDIKNNPREVLVEICRFLDVDPDLLPEQSNDTRRVNAVPYCKPPHEVVDYLKDVFDDQINFIEKKFNRDLKNW